MPPQTKQIAWDTRANCRLDTFTLQDAFIHNYGSHDDLLSAHGIDLPSGVGPGRSGMNETLKAAARAPNTASLAVHGGEPVRKTPMPPRIALGEDERRMVLEVLDHYAERKVDPGYQGTFEKIYTDAFVEMMGGGYADAVATGTSALYISVAALDLPKGSEVLVSPITDPGTLAAIVLNGLKPRLVDSRPDSYNVGPEQFAERVTPNVSAAIIVHAAGHAAEIDKIVEIARKHGIKVIEDCSQAHFARHKAKPVGTFGDIAAFSTMYRKAHMTGPSGGLVYSPNLDIFRSALAHSDRGKPRWRDDFDDRNPSTYLVAGAQPSYRRNLLRDRSGIAQAAASHHREPAGFRVRFRGAPGRCVRGLSRVPFHADQFAVLLSRHSRH